MKILNGLLVLLVLGLLYLVLKPNFNGHRRHDPKNYIINNLRQIDGAKQQWAYENNVTGNVHVAESDVSFHLGRGTNSGWVNPFAEERYIVKRLEELPEAHLTKKIGDMPKGTILRLHGSAELEIILPK